jgi:hypothetical protein
MAGFISVSYDTRSAVIAFLFSPGQKREGLAPSPHPISLENFSRVLRLTGCIRSCFQPDRPLHFDLGKCAWPVPTTVHENGALRRAAYTLIIAVSGQRLFDFWRQRARLGS